MKNMNNTNSSPLTLQKTLCPECASTLSAEPGSCGSSAAPLGFSCPKCSHTYPVNHGIIDLVGGEKRKTSLVQWAMELRPLVAIYEHIWRPLVTYPFSRLSWEMDMSVKLLDLAPSHDLLDIACGTGNFTTLFHRMLPQGTITGLDLSLPMLSQFQQENERKGKKNITLMRVDVTQWPFVSDTFDRIHCSGALHLFPRIENVFASIEKSLKPGGIFVGATYIKTHHPIKKWVQKLISERSGFHWFQPEELYRLAETAGFTDWEQHINKQGIVFRVKKKM